MKKIFFAVVFLLCVICTNRSVTADELDDYDFTEIDEIVRESTDFDFEKTVRDFFMGNTKESLESLGNAIIDALFGELTAQRKLIIGIITIGIVAALFTNISKAFLSADISKNGFYVTYMILMSTLIAGYAKMANVVIESLDRLISMMEVIVPSYIASIGFCTGESSAAAFYQVIAIVIALIEKIIRDMIIPMIYILMIMGLINNISEGNILSKACELIKTAIEWILKALLSFVIGLNVVQGMLSPVVDSIKTSAIGKAASLIPGVGGTITSVSKIVLGSGTLIKNSIGMASMTAIVAIMFCPVIESVAVSIGYKISGAILEPVSDKRIVNSVNSMYDCMVLLCKTLLYSSVFFMITLAIICNSTNLNMG